MGKAVKRKFAICTQKLRSPLILLRKLQQLFCRPCVTDSIESYLAPLKNRNRQAIAHAVRVAPRWKQAESDGHVISFVITRLALLSQVAHYVGLGGEGS